MRLRRFCAVAVVMLITLAVACGGKSSATFTPSVEVTGASSAPRSTAPADGASASHSAATASQGKAGHTFESKSKGYSVTYPTGWTVQENGASLLGFEADVFLAPADSGFSPNVNILCDKHGGGLASDDYLQASLNAFKSLNINVKTGDAVQVGGAKSKLVTYTASSMNQPLDFAQLYLTDARCGWVLTLTTKSGDRDEYMDVFLNMAKTFTLQ